MRIKLRKLASLITNKTLLLQVKCGGSESFIKSLNGNNQYQRYLRHLKQSHPHRTPLTKQQFFAKKEQDKWSKINRCC